MCGRAPRKLSLKLGLGETPKGPLTSYFSPILGLCVCGITGVSLFYADRAGCCSSPTKIWNCSLPSEQLETDRECVVYIFEVWVQMSCGRFHIATWSINRFRTAPGEQPRAWRLKAIWNLPVKCLKEIKNRVGIQVLPVESTRSDVPHGVSQCILLGSVTHKLSENDNLHRQNTHDKMTYSRQIAFKSLFRRRCNKIIVLAILFVSTM